MIYGINRVITSKNVKLLVEYMILFKLPTTLSLNLSWELIRFFNREYIYLIRIKNSYQSSLIKLTLNCSK